MNFQSWHNRSQRQLEILTQLVRVDQIQQQVKVNSTYYFILVINNVYFLFLEKPHLLEVSPPGNTPRFASASLLDKDNRGSTDCDENSGDASPPEPQFRERSERHQGGASKKTAQRGGLFVKGSKPRLKSMGSSASTDEVTSSGFISRGNLMCVCFMIRNLNICVL